MFKDKSKILVLGAIVALVLSLSNGGLFSHGFGVVSFHGFPKILLIALVVWMLFGCRGSRCGSTDGSDGADAAEDDSSDDGADTSDADANDTESDKD